MMTSSDGNSMEMHIKAGGFEILVGYKLTNRSLKFDIFYFELLMNIRRILKLLHQGF